MKFFTSFLFLFLSISTFASILPKQGEWIAKLQLNNTTELPFRMVIEQKKDAPEIVIKNGEEQINLIYKSNNSDTLIYTFKDFDSDLYLICKTNKTIEGYWHNKNRKGKYTIPFTAHFCKGFLFECHDNKELSKNILARKWKTTFAPGTNDEFPALGLFNQNDKHLSGTFLTETGDFRFLDGNIFGDKLYLSCFDGSHAFLFIANLKNDTLVGDFFSGTHYKTNWIANPDDQYELTDPNKLTYVVNDTPLTFGFNNINLEPFLFPNEEYKNKVTIIQIMGSWCPNCMDETRYYMDLHKKYAEQGLEIIMIGYESGANEEEYAEKLQRLKKRYSIPFTMLIGGAANKHKAAQDFAMLNNIISFPTSIFVDRNGKISKVHTGFTGPSTEEYYSEYMLETENLIKELLKN
jgi:thiol-disulfide isomerase/thioredoxin